VNPRFILTVKDSGWLQVLFVRLHKLLLIAASYFGFFKASYLKIDPTS
jgi:hypothetical protein